MLAMGPRDLNSAPYSPVHCSSHSMTSFQPSELTELPVVENSQLFAQRVHSARTAHGTPPGAINHQGMPLGHASTCDAGYIMSLLSSVRRIRVASTSTHHVMLTLSLNLFISSIPFIRSHTSHCAISLPDTQVVCSFNKQSLPQLLVGKRSPCKPLPCIFLCLPFPPPPLGPICRCSLGLLVATNKL